jgi:hypothetical protein
MATVSGPSPTIAPDGHAQESVADGATPESAPPPESGWLVGQEHAASVANAARANL